MIQGVEMQALVIANEASGPQLTSLLAVDRFGRAGQAAPQPSQDK